MSATSSSLPSSPASAPACRTRWARGWTLERVLFAAAGTVTALSALLAALVSPWFLLLTVFVAVNQWAFVLFGDCAMSLVLRRATTLTAANDA